MMQALACHDEISVFLTPALHWPLNWIHKRPRKKQRWEQTTVSQSVSPSSMPTRLVAFLSSPIRAIPHSAIWPRMQPLRPSPRRVASVARPRPSVRRTPSCYPSFAEEERSEDIVVMQKPFKSCRSGVQTARRRRRRRGGRQRARSGERTRRQQLQGHFITGFGDRMGSWFTERERGRARQVRPRVRSMGPDARTNGQRASGRTTEPAWRAPTSEAAGATGSGNRRARGRRSRQRRRAADRRRRRRPR